MKIDSRKIIIGICCSVFCLFVPIISRIPKGFDWVMQYKPQSTFGFMMELVIASPPLVIMFTAALISKTRFYLPLVFSFLTAVILLAYHHHDYNLDLSQGNLAGVGLVFISMQVSFYTFLAGLIGAGFEYVFEKLRISYT